MDTKIDSKYKRTFNLGYEIAKELDLKSPMLKGQNAEQNSTNAMQAGILQYVQEAKLSRNINVDNSVGRRVLKSNRKKMDKSKNKGNRLSL